MKGEVKITKKEFLNLLTWIKLNKKSLLNYWKVGTEISTNKFLSSLKPI